MSKRRVLEDTDSEGEGNGVSSSAHPPNTTSLLSSEQRRLIQQCHIKVNNGGLYSKEVMSTAIASLQSFLSKDVASSSNAQMIYEQYGVDKDAKDAFLETIYDPSTSSNGDDSSSDSPSEELILLKIEALCHSEKVVKAKLFRTMKGEVVFGPWFYDSLDRLA